MTDKTIRIFLADGEPSGILLAEIGNWTGTIPSPESVTGTAGCLSRRVRGAASAMRNDGLAGLANLPKAEQDHLGHLALGPHTELTTP